MMLERKATNKQNAKRNYILHIYFWHYDVISDSIVNDIDTYLKHYNVIDDSVWKLVLTNVID